RIRTEVRRSKEPIVIIVTNAWTVKATATMRHSYGEGQSSGRAGTLRATASGPVGPFSATAGGAVVEVSSRFSRSDSATERFAEGAGAGDAAENWALGELASCGPAGPGAAVLAAAPPAPRARSREACGAAAGAATAGAPLPVLVSDALARSVDAAKARTATPLAIAERVRSGAIQTGTDTRGTRERDGRTSGSPAIRCAVPRSSARRAEQVSQ